MRAILGLFLCAALCAGAWPAATASADDRCLEGAAASQDRLDLEALRAAIESTCDCAGALRRGPYFSCVRSLVDTAVVHGELRARCRGTLRRLERRSTCGFGPGRPRVVCLEQDGLGPGSLRCRIRPPGRCVSAGAVSRISCSPPDWPYTHCVDAADSSGDLRVAAPQDEGRCALSDTLFDVPSDAQPAETPGTPGVVVTNPKLLEQLGGAADLNRGLYTRWRFAGPERTPDAILVVVAGFGGGANNFRPLAQNLLSRAFRDHGLVLEVWGFHRRSNLLEDRAGAELAARLGDPAVALDWFYGAELGLPLHPELAAGPGRRALFYNSSDDVPFLAQWTPQVFSQDLDAVVQDARAVARNTNVFLGGHSAGTGFAARYAATDFDLSGAGPADPGFARLRGLVLLEGGGGSTGAAAPSDDTLDRIIAKVDGGLFGAVRDGAPRCVDGVTPCTLATEAVDCAGQTPPVCTPNVSAYTTILPGVGPGVLAAAEVGGVQAFADPDAGQALIQVDQGAPGNNAVAIVPDLSLLGILPAATAHGLFGSFLDDESLGAMFSPAVATSLGAPGPLVNGLQTWQDVREGPLPASVLPDNGPPPALLTETPLRWGREQETVDMARLTRAFIAGGANAADWYFAISGLSTLSAAGRCDAGTCAAGDVGAACVDDGDCAQSLSLDSSALSLDPPLGRGRRDIANLTQAGAIDIPVLAIGGSNGLTPVPGRFAAFAASLGACAAPSCDGTPRILDDVADLLAFPTFGGVGGGFEVHISEGLAHADVTFADDVPAADFYAPLADFLARNIQ